MEGSAAAPFCWLLNDEASQKGDKQMTTRLAGQMEPQQSFNRFYQEFVVEGKPQCVDKDIHKGGSCQYRTQEGRGCAIGIQPEFMADQ